MTMVHVAGVSIVVMAVLVASVWAGDPGHTTDSLDEVKARVEAKKAILVNVREQAEWNRGHIRGAVLIPYEQAARLGEGRDDSLGEGQAARGFAEGFDDLLPLCLREPLLVGR